MTLLASLVFLLACRSDTGLNPTEDSEDTGVDASEPDDTESAPVDTPAESDSPPEDTPEESPADTPVDTSPPPPTDADGDGHPEATDCNDHNPAVFPGNGEACDGVDADCIPTNEDVACGCTSHTFEGHTYAFCPVHLDWAGGRATCQLLGMDLVFAETEAENTFLSDTSAAVHPGLHWWMGLTDAASEGNFTSPSGAAPSFSAWCGGEPNNAHGGECSTQSAENCAVLNWCALGGWNDLPCDCAAESIGFICER